MSLKIGMFSSLVMKKRTDKIKSSKGYNQNWIPHENVKKIYSKSSISVVPSRWEEPFGRTAMESAAYGCATIISNKGGLPETFNSDLILKRIDTTFYTIY